MTDPSPGGIVFWILAAEIIISGLMVVSLRNIFHCALALIACLTGVAGIFLMLGAEFLAVAQVLIYVGAVAILMIFAIMLTSNIASNRIVSTNRNAIVAFFTCWVFVLGAVALLWHTIGRETWLPAKESLPADNIMTVGKLLMTDFMLPFEVVSVLLLAAIIGAIVLARREDA